MLAQPLIGLHQHLQHFLVRLCRRAQQLDDLGVTPLHQVQLGQVQALVGQQRLVQLAAGDRLLQQLQRLLVVTFGPREISTAAPYQGFLGTAGLGLDLLQHLASGGVITLLLRALRSLQRHEDGRVDHLRSLYGGREQ